ncbi:DNA sulfur modification protein DndB [Clostridium sp. ZS1]|uniref:DNA sulfur modification protein DndB n=1 Tax=Clostridium sp. ZS1 TaxID=2949989 RepID=UPI00207A5DC8|nr:DNA sulfur modification protein DndB [Clostridium sp. ZS1]
MNNENFETISAQPFTSGSFASGTDINSVMYYSGGRYWYACPLPFSVLGALIQTTSVKGKNAAISLEVVNRFLDKKHVNELKMYILTNRDNFTIPPVTLVSKSDVLFRPIDFGNGDFPNKDSLLEKVKIIGSALGKVTIPLGYTFTALDGNHRCKAIAELAAEHPDIVVSNNLLCNIVHETDILKIRQDFVDINQNAKTTTATINTLFDTRDPLARLTSEVINGIDYLGECVELFSASISKTSKKLYTLNNIKNSIVEISNHDSQSKSSIKGLSQDLKIDKNLQQTLKLELDMFYDLLKENHVIKTYLEANTVDEKVKARTSGVITSGVGLIIVSRVIANAAEHTEGFTHEEIIRKVIEFDWRRSNPFFKGKIISDGGNIISNISSIKETANALLAELFPEAARRKENK